MVIQFGLQVHLTSVNQNVSKINHLNFRMGFSKWFTTPTEPCNKYLLCCRFPYHLILVH